MGQNQRGGSGEKTEDGSAHWICADERQEARGKEEFYLVVLSVPCARDTRNCSKFRSKNVNYSETGGYVLTPFYDTCQKTVSKSKR